jgi:HD-GYP domain-containing protein (c-di-GMP phosphodiesterase class II)
VDGKGYPFGLVGEEIPFMGRLLAVADGFDAMTSDRPYRPGMPKEKALAILTDGAGTQWDRDLALAFVDLMRDRPLLKSEPEEAIS